MEFVDMFALSLIQGISEFLPISSSGHLAIYAPLMGRQDQGLGFDIALHLGTLGAVLIFCRHHLIAITQGLYRFSIKGEMNPDAKLGLLIILASLPVVAVGFLAKSFVEIYARHLLLIAATSIIFGVLLGLVDHYSAKNKQMDQMNWRNALWIGAMQVLALLPGTSRSAITITAARWAGFNRKDAAYFSFLLSIPTIMGAGVLMGLDLYRTNGQFAGVDFLIGGLIAFISALLAMKFLIYWLEKYGFLPFVIYRLLLGLGLIVYYQYFIIK